MKLIETFAPVASYFTVNVSSPNTPGLRNLQQAAALRHKTVTAFVLDSGLSAAAETLADRREFVLNGKQWTAFITALDAPLKPKSRLAKLLKTRSVLE